MNERRHAKQKTSLCPDDWTFAECVYHHGEGLGMSREEIDDQLQMLRDYEFNRGWQFWDLVASRWLTRHVERAANVNFSSARSQSASERTATALRLVARGH